MNESIVVSSDYKISKDGRKYPAKRFHMGTKKELEEASYKGNIGVMELAKFHSTASETDKAKFAEMMKKKASAKSDNEQKQMASQIWDHVQKVTNTKLHQMESSMISFKSLLEGSDDYILQTLADRDINASIKDGKVHVHDHSQHRKAQTLVKRMGMKHEVIKAPKPTNEAVEEKDSWKSLRSEYNGPGKGELLGNMSKEQHQAAIKHHQGIADEIVKGTSKLAQMMGPEEKKAHVTSHDEHIKQHQNAIKSMQGHGFEKGHEVTFYHSKHLPALPGKVTKATPDEVHIKTDRNEYVVHPNLVKAKEAGQAGVVVKKSTVKEDVLIEAVMMKDPNGKGKIHRPGSVMISVNHPSSPEGLLGNRYSVSFSPKQNSPRGRTTFYDVSHHKTEEAAKAAKAAYVAKHEHHGVVGLKGLGEDTSETVLEAMPTHEFNKLVRGYLNHKKAAKAGNFKPLSMDQYKRASVKALSTAPIKEESLEELSKETLDSYSKKAEGKSKPGKDWQRLSGLLRAQMKKKTKEVQEEQKLIVPTLKPRDPNYKILAMKKNAGGAHLDKKKEMKKGNSKHKGRVFESSDDE